MKLLSLFLAATLIVALTPCRAQNLETPTGYLSFIQRTNASLSAKYLSYISASSHGKSMRKVEKKRAELTNAIYEARIAINNMPSFSGDKSLRDSAVDYLRIFYSVFNEDYSNLVNMEEIAEQSYDKMEAYMTAQEKAGEKLSQAYTSYANTFQQFADRNQVKIVNTESELAQKLDEAEKISGYYHKVYLIFFKAYKQEMYLIDAMQSGNINSIEQNRTALANACEEGIAKLKELKGYSGDRSIESACKQVLVFLKDEAEKKIPVMTDFLMAAEGFNKMKAEFEAKANQERTKELVDAYNKAGSDLNKKVTAFNNTNQQLNSRRSDLVSQYNDMVRSFMDTYMPYSR